VLVELIIVLLLLVQDVPLPLLGHGKIVLKVIGHQSLKGSKVGGIWCSGPFYIVPGKLGSRLGIEQIVPITLGLLKGQGTAKVSGNRLLHLMI